MNTTEIEELTALAVLYLEKAKSRLIAALNLVHVGMVGPEERRQIHHANIELCHSISEIRLAKMNTQSLVKAWGDFLRSNDFVVTRTDNSQEYRDVQRRYTDGLLRSDPVDENTWVSDGPVSANPDSPTEPGTDLRVPRNTKLGAAIAEAVASEQLSGNLDAAIDHIKDHLSSQQTTTPGGNEANADNK